MSFRADLLAGRALALAGGGAPAIAAELARLGARLEAIADKLLLGDEDEAAVWVAGRTPLHGLVFDATASFGAGGQDGLRRSLELAWLATRATANGALISAGDPAKLVLIAPAPDAGVHAEATRAALENLARTLSVEWARFAITAVAVCPGARTTAEELAQLVSFLHSPAGGYLSGCRLDLGRAQDQQLIRAS